MKVALFGGSFDPVHKGHLAIAEEACRCCRFDRFFFVPAALSPFKHPGTVSADFRLKMLEEALKGVPDLPVEIDRSEIDRGGLSFSIDTIRSVRNRFPEASVTWIAGDDILPDLPRWKEADELSRVSDFLVFRRTEGKIPVFPNGFRIRFLEIAPVPYSSSEIRRQIAAGIPPTAIPGLLPVTAAFIEKEGLYR